MDELLLAVFVAAFVALAALVAVVDRKYRRLDRDRYWLEDYAGLVESRAFAAEQREQTLRYRLDRLTFSHEWLVTEYRELCRWAELDGYAG